MSESYSGSLKSIEIRPFVEVISPAIDLRDKRAGRFTLGSISNGLSPTKRLSSDSTLAVNHLLVMHDAYLSAACDYSKCYESEIPSQRYLLSSIVVTTDKGGNGRHSKTEIPLLISPVSVATIVASDSTEHIRPGILGLYCRHGLIVSYDGNKQSFTATLRHEVGHAVLDALPWLKDEMYGGDDSTQMEEICMHVVMDHFDKFMNLGKLSISSHSVPGKPISKATKDEYWDSTVTSVLVNHTVFDSVTFNGANFVKSTVTLTSADDATYNDAKEVFSYYSKHSRDNRMILGITPGCNLFSKKG